MLIDQDDLTAAQLARIAMVRDRWTAIGRATGPTDRGLAEEGAARALADAGLSPRPVVWVGNPAAGLRLAKQAGAGPIALRKLEARNQRAILKLQPGVRERIRAELRVPLWDSVGAQFAQIATCAFTDCEQDPTLTDSLRWTLRSWADYWRHFVFRGPIDARDLGVLEFLAECGLRTPGASGFGAVARAGVLWWSLPGAVVLTERPTLFAVDGRGRLHSDNGPAVRYPDGWSVWSWHGHRVTARVIREPESLDPRKIAAGELEAEGDRRVLLDRIGLERLLRGAVFEVAHADRGRMLYRVPVPGDEPVMIAKVRCPSTGKDHLLRVPPHVTTCAAAVAWTFGMDASNYAPAVET